MGQALKMCVGCETQMDCYKCTELHEWIMEHMGAEPVRHGWWKEFNRSFWRDKDGDVIAVTVDGKCSCCGRHVWRYDNETQDDYCPSCGARMEKEV